MSARHPRLADFRGATPVRPQIRDTRPGHRKFSEEKEGPDGQRWAFGSHVYSPTVGLIRSVLFVMGLREARIDHAHRPDESVSFADHGFQKARLRGVIPQSRTDFAHDVVDVWLGIDEKIRAPKFRNNIFARDQLFPASSPGRSAAPWASFRASRGVRGGEVRSGRGRARFQ